MKRPLTIYLGKGHQISGDNPYLLIGDCVEVKEKEPGNKIAGCPPDRETMLDSLVQAMST